MYYIGKTPEEQKWIINRSMAQRMCYETIFDTFNFSQIVGAEFLQKHSFHKLRIEELGGKETFKYVHIIGENVEEVDREYMKCYILSFLIYNGSEKLRNYLVDNNIFIAPNLLDHLRERIPYDAIDDWELFFLVDEGNISVSKYGRISMTDVF